MACFLVTVVEAIVVTAAAQAVKSKEKDSGVLQNNTGNELGKSDTDTKIPFSRKLRWLSNLLWGGSFLLAFEHVWHGEVVPWFPFLTAASNPGDTAEMLHEMSTVGVSMMIFVTVVWIGMVLISNAMTKKALKQGAAAKAGGTL